MATGSLYCLWGRSTCIFIFDSKKPSGCSCREKILAHSGFWAHCLCCRAAIGLCRFGRTDARRDLLLELFTALGLRILGPSADGGMAYPALYHAIRANGIRRAR